MMAGRFWIRGACACLCTCVFTFSAAAIDYVFPAGAGVVDITKSPYNADRTGKTDVSSILTNAANAIINNSGWGPGTLYLPNGTYLVKNTFAWRLADQGNGTGPHLVGQSRTGTVIKLAKGTWPLGTEGKGVIQTGAGVEQSFNKSIMNLTVLVDSNNAGAIGIIYVSNNDGLLSDVNIISADGKGMYGIQAAGSYTGSAVGGNGPYIIRRTYVKGFQVGIRTCSTQSAMASQIRLEGQTKYGIWASCGDLTIDSLTTNDTCIAVEAEAAVVLVNAVLLGGSPTTNYAIRNFVTSSFFRNIRTSGYKFAISSVGIVRPPLVSAFDEYSPSGCISLFSTATRSMNIPARYPPDVPWESDMTKWAFIEDYKSGRTDVQALQAAIDDPAKTTICLLQGKAYLIDQPVYVRGNISRIYSSGGTLHNTGSNGKLIIDAAGTAPAIMIQKISMQNIGSGGDPDVQIVKRTTRTLVLESLNQIDFSIEEGGDVFITDITSNKNHVNNANARVWIWQWEGDPLDDSTLTVRNGIVRSVGYYDEGDQSMLFCLGGITEILGYWDYNDCISKSGEYLLTVGNNANVSAAGVWQQNFCSPWAGYDPMVSETRSGTTKLLYGSAGAGRVVSPAGSNIALYTAYDSAQVKQAMAVGALRPIAPAEKSRIALSVRQQTAGMEVQYRTASAGPVTLIAYDLAGRIIAVANEHPTVAGVHRAMLPHTARVAYVQVRIGGTSMGRIAIGNN
jgi:hypothetical protein